MTTLYDFNIKTKKPWEIEGVEWREVKLGEVCQRRSENVIPAGENQIYVGLEHINSGEIKLNRWEYSNKVKSMKYKFYPNDILYGKLRPYLDKAVVSDKEGICSTDFIVIKPIRDKILPYYLVFFLHTNIFINYATSMMKGVHLPRVSWTIIKRFKIPIPFRNGKPDLETQKKIVEYIEANFSRIDKILEKKKREIEWLDELWESVLEQAFKPKDGEEWREVRFNKLISKEKYQVGKVKVRNGLANSGKIPVIDQSQELIRGYLDNEELKYKGPLPLIIFGDHTKVIKFIDFPFIVGADGVKILIPNKDLIYPKYFCWLLRKVKLPDRGYARHFKILKQATYLIPFRKGKPDIERQKEIADYLDRVYEKIKTIKEKVQFQISQLDEMKESILDEVFSHDKCK